MKSIYYFAILSILFLSCDKNGETLKNGNKVELTKDGVVFIDEQSAFLPPGAKDGPRLEYYTYPEGYVGENIDHLSFTSTLHQKGNKNSDKFSILIYLPITDAVVLHKKYELKPMNGVEIFEEGSSAESPTFKHLPFIRYKEDYKTDYYGTGHITFTNFDASGNPGRSKGEGLIEFTVPNKTGGLSIIKGNFKIK